MSLFFSIYKILYLLQVSEWPWILYYTCRRKKRGWEEGLTTYTVSETDVVKKITPPDIEMEGRSLIYIFDGKI